MAAQLRPKQPVRRFDVFAEYQRLVAQDDGIPADQAKGHGLWVAKLVAARKFRRTRSQGPSNSEQQRRPRKWHVLGGEPQTDKRFIHEVVDRMGDEFYRDVFAPAIRAARENGQTYELMRDRIRRRWKPE